MPIERPRADAQHVAAGLRHRRVAAMTQLHLDARKQFVQVKGLGEVVVGAQLQKVDLVRSCRARRGDNDGRGGIGRADEAHNFLAG